MNKHSIETFLERSEDPKFAGWPLVEGSMKQNSAVIPYFGSTIDYKLQTPNGEEAYTSIIRSFGWAVVFGVTEDNQVLTLIQWKPGVNCASWELPPGGIGKIGPDASLEEISETTMAVFLAETGYGNGNWASLGKVAIETGKFRGAGPDDHGLFAHLFVATGLQPLQGQRNPRENEIMETLMVPVGEFLEVLQSGFFVEVSAVACAYKALVHLGLLGGQKKDPAI